MEAAHWRDPVEPPVEPPVPVIQADTPSLYETIRKRPRRRWWLHSTILGVCVLPVVAGISFWYFWKLAERGGPQVVAELNGRVRYQNDRPDDGIVTGITLRGKEIQAGQISRLRPWWWRFPHLTDLDLSGAAISDANLSRLPGSPLHTLVLDDTPITDAGMPHLAKLRSLHSLSLENTAVTDEGLGHLRQLPVLNALYLGGTKLTDAGLPLLAEMKSLEYVRLDERISDEAVSTLQVQRGDLRISK